ncbi:hypothetical protein IWX50DRAFT_99878 [Phyllosticta citricarpa]
MHLCNRAWGNDVRDQQPGRGCTGLYCADCRRTKTRTRVESWSGPPQGLITRMLARPTSKLASRCFWQAARATPRSQLVFACVAPSMANGTPRGRSPHLLGLGANSDGCRGAPRGRQRRRFSIAMLIFIINADHRLRRRDGTFLRKTNRGPAAPPLPASIALPYCYHDTYLSQNSISNRRLFIRQSPSWWPSCRGTGPAKACISFHEADKISESLCNDNLPMSGSRLGWFFEISNKFGRWRHGWAKFMAWKLQDKKTRTY